MLLGFDSSASPLSNSSRRDSLPFRLWVRPCPLALKADSGVGSAVAVGLCRSFLELRMAHFGFALPILLTYRRSAKGPCLGPDLQLRRCVDR